MERVITFGCSLTYGHGLPDCFSPPRDPGLNPSNLGWPSIIAKCLDRECINISSPGASNKKIWNDVIHFDYQETDIVFVLWSYIERSSIIHSSKKITFIGPWAPDHSNYYKEFYDKHDATLMSSLFVNHANMFLQQKNITMHNIIPGTRELPILELNNIIVKHIPIYITDIRDYHPLALDKRHPGIECQTAYSKKILDFLNIKNDLPEIKELNMLGKIKRQFIEMTRGD
jgi:hypothetical protein